LPLKNRRDEYSWPKTRIEELVVTTDKRGYSIGETVKADIGFRVIGGLREAFHPDVWTVAWEDFDKILRLTMRLTLTKQSGIRSRKLRAIKKEVRRASFYWSRDPDLPYRIWAMIIPEDGGPPKIPRNVEDARSKMLDVDKDFSFPASALGAGKHRLVAEVKAHWGRRSFIEKGDVTAKSKPVVVQIE
jgi:hypothetical protein